MGGDTYVSKNVLLYLVDKIIEKVKSSIIESPFKLTYHIMKGVPSTNGEVLAHTFDLYDSMSLVCINAQWSYTMPTSLRLIDSHNHNVQMAVSTNDNSQLCALAIVPSGQYTVAIGGSGNHPTDGYLLHIYAYEMIT